MAFKISLKDYNLSGLFLFYLIFSKIYDIIFIENNERLYIKRITASSGGTATITLIGTD